jgi:2-keto-4-pentenoate hydratase
MKRLLSLALCPGLFLALPVRAEIPSAEAVYRVLDDYLARRPSLGYTNALTMSEALRVQRAFIAGLEPDLGHRVGYKVALVTREMQERFGLNEPVRGVLLEKMLVPNHAEVPLNFGVRLVFEADLIVTVKDQGINKATTPLEVAKHLKEVVAFIELPDAFLATNQPVNGPLLTAINVGARLGVLGERAPVKGNQNFVNALAAMRVSVTDETGKLLGEAQGLNILDHPLNAVLWLVEDLRGAGESLKPGDLLSLGSLRAFPLPAGKTLTVRYEGLPSGPLKVSVRTR